MAYLRVEVEESTRTVDVIEWSKAPHGTIYGHWVEEGEAPVHYEQPVGIVATQEHLCVECAAEGGREREREREREKERECVYSA